MESTLNEIENRTAVKQKAGSLLKKKSTKLVNLQQDRKKKKGEDTNHSYEE